MLSGTVAGIGLLLAAMVFCAGCGGEGTTVGAASSNVFPNDMTPYPGAKNTGPDEKLPTQLTTPDPVKSVVDFYSDKSKNGGWDAAQGNNMGPSHVVLTLTKEGKRFTLHILAEKNATGGPETRVETSGH